MRKIALMLATTPGRRLLRFDSYAEVLADVERAATGHRTLGNWTLAQICGHLANTHEYSLGGREPTIRTSPLFRATVGRAAWWVLLAAGYIPERRGGFTLGPMGDLARETERLRASVERISRGRMIALHPIFGRLSHDRWRRFHLHHAAHHLSFVVPETPEHVPGLVAEAASLDSPQAAD